MISKTKITSIMDHVERSLVTDYAVQELILLLEIRNFNGHYYLNIDDKWVYFTINDKKYTSTYHKISEYFIYF